MPDNQIPDDLLDELDAAEAAPPQPADALGRLSALAQEVETLDQRIERGEELLSALKQRRYQVLTREMVDVMDEQGVERVTAGGREYKLDTEYKANIPKERRDEGHDWLEANGSGALITYQVQADFPPGHEEDAKELVRYIRERYQMSMVELDRSVPWKRLTSWFKEQYGTRTLPMDLLGAHVMRIVRVPKPRAGRR